MGSYIFQEYKRGSRRGPQGQPRITITRTGVFSVNSTAFEMLGRPAYVAFLFDRGSGAIGFKKVDKDSENAYPVRKQKNSASYLVSGKAFLQFIGAGYGEEIIRLIPRKEQDFVVVDLPRDESREPGSHPDEGSVKSEPPGSLLGQDGGPS